MAKQLLTNSFCKSAVHSGKNANTNYFDTELTGFMLEVRKTGAKTFYLRYQSNGKTRVHKIGDAKAMTASIAREQAKALKSEINLGKDIYLEKQLHKKAITVDDFYQSHYLPHIKQKNRSWQTTESIFRIHILPRWGKMLQD